MDSMIYRARAERRRESRFDAEVEATLNWNGISQPVTIRNISMYGALVTGTWLPTVGEWVTLITERLEVCGTVIWDGPDRCGLLLNRPIDPMTVIAEGSAHQMALPPVILHGTGPSSYA